MIVSDAHNLLCGRSSLLTHLFTDTRRQNVWQRVYSSAVADFLANLLAQLRLHRLILKTGLASHLPMTHMQIPQQHLQTM
jgi:hypothetical protein